MAHDVVECCRLSTRVATKIVNSLRDADTLQGDEEEMIGERAPSVACLQSKIDMLVLKRGTPQPTNPCMVNRFPS